MSTKSVHFPTPSDKVSNKSKRSDNTGSGKGSAMFEDEAKRRLKKREEEEGDADEEGEEVGPDEEQDQDSGIGSFVSSNNTRKGLAYYRKQDSLTEEDDDQDTDNRPLMGGPEGQRRPSRKSSHISFGNIKILKPRRKRIDRCCRQNIGNLIFLFSFVGLLAVLYFANERFRLVEYLPRFRSFGSFGTGLKSFVWDGSPLHGNPSHQCDRLEIGHIWNATFPRLTLESAFRVVDVNNDTIDDIIFGFGTGADAPTYPDLVCQIYFNDSDASYGCGGGIMALNGKDGSIIWSRLTRHELFALNCEVDLTGDGIPDCVAGGQMASLYAVDSANGDILWGLLPDHEAIADVSNFYTPLYIPKDLDGDSVPDLILMHGGDPLRKAGAPVERVARLIIVSARKGTILSFSPVPDNRESYYAPQVLTRPDGGTVVLFGTGGETHGGSLWVIGLEDLLHRRISRASPIYTDCCKGVMVPPVIVDVNGDSFGDIVMAMFNGTVIAFDGLTYKQIWSHAYPGHETYSVPAVGRFNSDEIPDFMVIYQQGPGFPVYYKTIVDVLDGRNGQSLLTKPISMKIGTQSSPLTVSTTGPTDHFLFWYVTCDEGGNSSTVKSTTTADGFQFAPDTSVAQSSRADFCRLRFNSTFYSQLRLLSPKGQVQTVIYDSRAAKRTEYPHIDYSHLGEEWFRQHEKQLFKPVIDEDYEMNLQSAANLLQEAMQREAMFGNAQEEAQPPPPFPGADYNDGLSGDRSSGALWSQLRHMGRRNRIKRQTTTSALSGEGIQRLISTGSLIDSLNTSTSGSIDYVFGTFWFPPSENVKLLSPAMSQCLAKYRTPEKEAEMRLTDPSSRYYNIDHDAYMDLIKELCVTEAGEPFPLSTAAAADSSSPYDPFNRKMGAMTIYRYGLSCGPVSTRVQSDSFAGRTGRFWRFSSGYSMPNKIRGSLFPYGKQIWPAYMGEDTNSVANV